ncbi:IS1 family transposase [Candidatus Bathyarchaeota archaeon A05DMB-2]|nr:IS1 family transposase [Candidatus Bathyarchaeota archaeon A05DMB-2]
MAFALGKWTQQTCSEMICDFKRSLRPSKTGEKIEVFTDGNDDYTYALPCFFKVRQLNYAQLVKIRDANGRLIKKEVRVVYGDPDHEDVETVNVENFNSILRERVGRLVRKTKCFSKERSRLWCAVILFQFYWDFISEIRRGVTPAMMENCSTHVWTWHEFYYSKLLTNTN